MPNHQKRIVSRQRANRHHKRLAVPFTRGPPWRQCTSLALPATASSAKKLQIGILHGVKRRRSGSRSRDRGVFWGRPQSRRPKTQRLCESRGIWRLQGTPRHEQVSLRLPSRFRVRDLSQACGLPTPLPFSCSQQQSGKEYLPWLRLFRLQKIRTSSTPHRTRPSDAPSPRDKKEMKAQCRAPFKRRRGRMKYRWCR